MATTVGKVGEIAPGNMANFQVGGESIVVANVEARLYAFNDICTHIGCSLYEGSLDGTTVICPCHGSEFDVTTGTVMRGPARDPIKTYAVQIVGEELQI